MLNRIKIDEGRYSLSDEDFIVKDGTARWTEDRIDRLIHDNGAKFEEDYSYAYATLMIPRDFLKLTVDDKFKHSKLTFDERSILGYA